jgi:WD40 repeat protein
LLLTTLSVAWRGLPLVHRVPPVLAAVLIHAAWGVGVLFALSASSLISERVISISPNVQALAFSPDGRVITATFGGGISPESFAVDTGSPVPRPPGAEAPPPYAGDGQQVLTDGMSIALVDEAIEFRGPWGSRRVQGHFPMKTVAIALSPDGQRLASCGTDNVVRLWNPADGSLLKTLWGHSDDVLAVAFSPDGRRLASASRDRTLRLWSGF